MLHVGGAAGALVNGSEAACVLCGLRQMRALIVVNELCWARCAENRGKRQQRIVACHCMRHEQCRVVSLVKPCVVKVVVQVANLHIETYGLPVRTGLTHFGEIETLNLLWGMFENDVQEAQRPNASKNVEVRCYGCNTKSTLVSPVTLVMSPDLICYSRSSS